MAVKKKTPTPLSSFDDLDAAGIGVGYQPFAADAVAPMETPAEPERTWGAVVKDVGVSALKGAIAVPEAAVGMADLLSGGRAGKVLEDVGFRPGEAKAILDEQYSDKQKQAFQSVSQAEGFTGKMGAALANPSVIGHTLVESAPLMGMGGVIGRGVMAAAPRVSGVIAGAIGEGAVGAGSSAEAIRQASQDGTLTGKQAALAGASGALTGAFTLLGGKVAQKLGIADVDTMLAGAATNPAVRKGVVRSALEGAAAEGILEELPQSVQEQVLQNAALGKPLDEGVDQAAVMGLLSGMAMGGGANAVSSFAKPPAKEAADTIRATETVPESGPMTRASNAATEAKAQAIEAGAPLVDEQATAEPTPEPVDDPVRDQILALPEGARQDALRAYAVVNRTDVAKGVQQYNRKLLDRLLSENAPPPVLGERLTDTDMGSMLGGGGMAGRADPLAGALGMNNEAQANSITNVANVAERRPPMPASDAARMLDEARTRGLDLAVAEHPAGGFVLIPPNWVTPDMAAQGEARLAETIARMQQADAAPVERTPRTSTAPVDLSLQTDPVQNYLDSLRSVNTPAARAYVRDFDAGRITPADVQQRMQAERGLTPEQRIARAAAEAPATADPVADRLQRAAAQGVMAMPAPTDILNPAGQPFKTRMAADRAAKKTPGAVVPVEGGFVVRPKESVSVQDVPQAPEVPQAAPAISQPGQAPQAVGAQPAGPAAGVPAEGVGAVEAVGMPPRGRDGYDTPVTLDAASLKALVEKTRGAPLVDKPEKLEAWRNGTAKTDPAKFPIELAITPDGSLDVNDGRHRIALAAERGEKVTAFIDGNDAQRAQSLVSQTNQQQAKAQQEQAQSQGAADQSSQIAEAVSKADRLDLKGAERAQWVKDSLAGAWGMTADEVGDMPEVAAGLRKKPSKEDATAATVRRVEQVVRQAGKAAAINSKEDAPYAATSSRVAKEAKPSENRFVVKDDITGSRVEWQALSPAGDWTVQTTFDNMEAATEAVASLGIDPASVSVWDSAWNAKAKRFTPAKKRESAAEQGLDQPPALELASQTPAEAAAQAAQPQGTAEQAIRDAFQALPSVSLGEFYPITVQHNGREQQFLASQRAIKRGNQPHAALTLLQVRRGRIITGADLQDIEYTYKLSGKNELTEESVRPASDELIRRWRDAFAPTAETQPVTPLLTAQTPEEIVARQDAGVVSVPPVIEAAQLQAATHTDPGEKAEAATPAVVTDSLKKAARNEDTKPSEMRKWLVGKIDEAIAVAPEAAVDFLSFDVPGDGTFKVQNSQARLQEFRKKVMASPGFKDSGQRQNTQPPEQTDSARNGSGSTVEAIRNFLADGDVQSAVEFAKLKGVEFTPVEPRASMTANGKFKRVPASVKSSVPSVADGLTQVEAEQINQYLTAEQARAEPAAAAPEQPKQAPTATEPVAHPITRADVTAAQQQTATLIAERIDAMTAQEVQAIARRFLPTMGVAVPAGKARIKAAVTDFTKVNPMAAADEFGVTLPADVRRALDAEMQGNVADGFVEPAAAKPAADAKPAAAAPAAPIEDAGEKIGGARKDRWKERGLNLDDLDAMTEAEGAELATKANVWKPDYDALAEASEPVTAAMVKTIYDQLAAKPKKNTPEGRRQYVQMMRIVRDVLTEAKGPDAVRNAYLEIRKRAGLNTMDPKAKEVARGLLFSVYKGRSDPFVLGGADLMKAKKMVEDGFPAKAAPWKSRLTVGRREGGNGVTERGIEMYMELSADVGTPLSREQIEAGFFRVVDKQNKTVAFAPTKEDAEAAAETVYERDLKGKKDSKPEPVRPNLDEIKRENLPRRIDRDVTADDFVKDLGFRGIEFGLWSAQDERQRILNMAYDGLMDLAEIMGVPPKAMSLNGTLGMAFGARGGGRFAAHYEPGKLVINMTKIRGGGSMAHEWAHAMDHYFGELDKDDAYTTQARGASGWYAEDQYVGVPRKRMERVGNEWKNVEKMRLDNLRPEMAAAFDEVMRALFSKQITKAEMVRSHELDLERTEALARNETQADLKAMYQNMAQNKRQALNELRGDPEGTMYAGRGRSDYASQAQALSGKSVDGYWVRPTEMFARAFESWVFDRVTAMGARSDYLVHGVEEDRFAGGGYKGNPYPTGEERARINAAFDKLASTIKTKQTDKGVAMFSRTPAAQAAIGTPAATIRASITKAYGKLLGQLESNGLVTLTQTQEQAIEAAAQARADKTGQPVEQARATLRASVKNSVADQTQTESFKRWFKDSKAVDAEGKPLVVYHGTGADFSEFSASKIGSVWGADTVGFFFTDSAKIASSYATSGGPTLQRDEGANIIPAYIRISRPVTVEALEAFTGESGLADAYESPIELMDERRDDIMSMLLGNEQDGWSIDKDSKPSVNNTHDGVIFSFGGSTLVVAVDPTQIKSAIGNRGTFDPADPDIRRSADGSVQGFFDPQTGQSFLIADNLTAEAAPGVLMHEVGIHMAADGSMKALFNRAAMMLKLQRGNPFIKAVQARMDAAGETSGEEAAAYIAEAYENDRANAPASVQRWLADLLAAVKAWMFKKGIMGADRLTVADIAAVARANARSMARDGGETGGQGFGPAFSHAPAGDQTQTESFRRWFKGSKAVDAEGKPLMVYHGTASDVDAFNPQRSNSKSNTGAPAGTFFFSDKPDVASSYTVKWQGDFSATLHDGANVMPVYLSIEKPLKVSAKGESWREIEYKGQFYDINELTALAKESGRYDGLIVSRVRDKGVGSVTSKTATTYVAFRPEQIKSAIGNRGTFDPANPDIRFSRTTEAAKAAGDAIKSVTVTNIKQRAGFKLTDYLGIGLQALGRRQIVDIYGDLLPLGEYNRLVQQMEADKNEGGAEADQLVNRWAKLDDEAKLADLMHDATLAQIDPDKDYVDGDDKGKFLMLERKFTLLSDEAKAVYRDTRDAYKAHHAKVRSAIKERIERSEIKGERKAALLKQMDDEFFKAIKGVYFPLARFGQYAVTVKGPDGKVESVSRAETKAEAEALRSSLLSAFPRDKGFTVGRVMLSKDFIADRDAVGRGFMTELYQVLDKQDMDAAQRAELEDTLGQLYLSSLPDLSWAKHGIHRKGTPGFSQDARRAFAQNMFHGARYLAKLRYSDLMQDELAAMQKHVDDWREVEDFDQNSAQRVVDEMNKRHESLMNPKSNPLSTALTSFGFIFHLGLSPASAMVNLSQTALVAYPIMGAKWGFGKASAALLKASAEAAKGKNDITASLNADERAAYDEAVRAGTIDVTMAHDLAGIAQGEDAGVMWKIRPIMRWASFFFHHAERFNRQVTFVAAYRLARDAGADHKAAFEQATKATYDGHFDYGAANRPRIMQGNVAKVLLLFKQYGQNMVYTLARNAQQAIKGESPEVRSQARKALGGLLATHAAAAGVLGLPMVTTLLAAVSMIGGDDDEPWDAKVALQNMLADALGQKPAEVLAHGLSRLTPWDISGRVGLDKLIFPDVQEGLEGQRLGEAAMAAALGPVAGIGINVLKGLQDMSQGQYARGLEAMMPAALRGPIKAIRYESEGVQDKTGVVIKDDVSLAGVAGQFLGFSPSEVRNATEGKSAVIQQDRALGERRQELLTKAARATMAKDAEARAEAMKEIERFNQKNPTRRITPLNVLQSVRNRQKRIDQAEGGVYLPKNRRDAMEAGRFAVAE